MVRREAVVARVKRCCSVDLFLFFVALFLLYYTVLVALNNEINPDEIEHLHSAWYIKNGYLPFVDFFQHHSPLFWYLLAPLPGLSSENPEVILHARVLMAIISLLTALIAGLCAVKIGQTRTHGLLAFVIVSSVLFYVERSTNVRPDGLSTLLAVVSFFFFLDTGEVRRRNIIGTGVFISLAYLVSQKAAFVTAFYLLYYGVHLLRRRLSFRLYLLFVSILVSPLLISVVYGIAIGGLHEFFFNNYLLNISKSGFSGKWQGLLPIFTESLVFWIVAFVGVTYAVMKRRENPKLMVASLLGLTVFAAALKSSFYPQYYIPVVPFFAIVITGGFLRVTGQMRRRGVAIVVLVLACISAPVWNMKDAKVNRNAAKIEMIGYLTGKAAENDCIYDEKRAFNIFRRDAHYLWYHPPLRRQYIKMTGRYSSYDRCEVIQSSMPAVVAAGEFRFSHCAVFDRYRESRYEGFYVREGPPGESIPAPATGS